MEARSSAPSTDPGRHDAAAVAPLPVEVIRSARRTKTSAARIVDGTIEVRIPAWLSDAQARRTVDDLVARLERARQLDARSTDLERRSHALARRYGLPRPHAIRWVGNQARRWGSCTPTSREIRISSRLRHAPGYVLDYVIVHELAHLVERGHGPAFRALEDRFPQRERAEGFLEAMALGLAADEYCAD